MLYISTRNKTDSFTAYRAMHNDVTPDGGLFVPFRIPRFSEEEIASLSQLSFGEVSAKILNLFFSEQLTGWDVDFCIGRSPVKVENAGYKTLIAELWHNHDGVYDLTRNTLFSRICGSDERPSQWAEIAIDIAVLFAAYCTVNDVPSVDIALTEDNTSAFAAVWYARKMGLPIGKIILTCSEHSPLWEFVLRGNLNTAALKEQGSGAVYVVERLIYDVYGIDEAAVYLEAVSRSKSYSISEEILLNMNADLSAVAVSSSRAETVIKSALRTNGYHMSVDAALSFGGLQDYRARTGESKTTLLLSASKPAH